jgi:hypothetical protein
VAPEYRQESIGFVVGLTLQIHLGIRVVEEGEHIQGAVTDVFELLEAFAHPLGLQIRR